MTEQTKRPRGRPPERTETVWVRVNQETKEWLAIVAHGAGVSVSAYIASLIAEHKGPASL